MAQQVKASLVAQVQFSGSMWKERTDLTKLTFDLHRCSMVHALPSHHTHIQIINKTLM